MREKKLLRNLLLNFEWNIHEDEEMKMGKTM